MSNLAPALRTVVIERNIPSPPEKLWRALTQPHLIAEWLMQSDFKPIEGHHFNLRKESKPDASPNGGPDASIVIDCEVLTVDPNQTLAYTWNAMGLQSVVTFTLTPTSTGTHLRMEQAGFRPDQQQAFKGAKAGWRRFLTALDQAVARMA